MVLWNGDLVRLVRELGGLAAGSEGFVIGRRVDRSPSTYLVWFSTEDEREVSGDDLELVQRKASRLGA
jgi:hypothetical protein